jgi:hypothetical protein
VTLYKNGATTGSSCTVASSQSSCTITGATVAVNGTSDTIVLAVNKTAGTSYAGTATASAVHSVGLNGQIVFKVPTGGNYTITAWGATTSSALTGQTVSGATSKTLTVS